MLKSEVIKANPVLSGLTDEQVTTIETLSQNDENTVMAAKIGEIYGGIDKDVLESSGIPKNGIEKTYDYVKRVSKELKEKAGGVDGLNTQIQALTADKNRLEKAIQDNATDKEAMKKLKSIEAELDATKMQYNDIKTKFDQQEVDFKEKLYGYRVGNEIQQATTGIAFKKEFPDAVTKQILSNAINNLKSGYKHEFIDDGNGNERMVFLDKEKGARLNNPENQLNPFTATELLKRELKTMGVLDEGRQQAGGGTNHSTGAGVGSKGSLDLSSAKTKVEAHNMADQALMQQGLPRGSKEYQDAMNKAWVDYKVTELPTE